MKRICLVILAGVGFLAVRSEACSAVIVGKDASASGRVIVAHNEDGALTLRMRYALVPARDGKLSYFWCECKNPAGGITPGDTMLNECGVIVLSNNGGFMKTWCGRTGTLPDEGVHSSLGNGGVGYELRRTVAERAHSAREGVAVATNLLATCGYTQASRNFVIADRDEAWILSVIRGRRYVARRCPDDAVVAYPNCLPVTKIRPGDIVSANIEPHRADFDFTQAYQGPRTWKSPYNLYRMKSLYRIVCGGEPDCSGDYPFSMRPAKPVDRGMIMAALRSHHEGTSAALTPPHPKRANEVSEACKAPVCRETTRESFVCSFADDPADIDLALAVGRPCEHPYAHYRPFGGVLPTNVSRGEEALRRIDGRATPLAKPTRVGVFAGNGPRANGFAEYLRLVNDSPDLELTLLDADDVRNGALAELDLFVAPGGDSRTMRRDLGEAGGARLREFLANGGGYIGSCAGCCLLLDSTADPERGIGVIPYRRTGSKGGYQMPVRVNAAGAKALGVPEGVYNVRYHAGPVLEPTSNVLPGANFEIWGTYEHDFGKPGSKPEMAGRGAMVGGTFGKGRVFAFAVHPETYPATRELVRGAFRYVLGRDVEFPERVRRPGALTVGWYSNAMAGKDTARTMLAIDAMKDADLVPLASDDIDRGLLDHVDVLVLPDGHAGFYGKKLTTSVKTRISAFQSRGGEVVGWGAGAQFGGAPVRAFDSASDVLAHVKARVCELTRDSR